MPASETEESDWSSSDCESVVQRIEEGTECSATYKGTKYAGKATATSNDVPTDVVPFLTAEGVAVWCRDPGDGVLVPLSRGECRKMAADVIGKSAKSESPTESDIAACGVMFGTPFPVQMKPAESKSVAEKPKDESKIVKDSKESKESKHTNNDRSETVPDSVEETVAFKYNKQQLSGKKISFTKKWIGSADIIAVSVDQKGTAGVFWVVKSASDSSKMVAMTVTDAKKTLKTILGKAIGVDGPTSDDDDACKTACGTPCPVQLHDARARNERAKQKRAAVPPVTVKRKVTEVLMDSDMVAAEQALVVTDALPPKQQKEVSSEPELAEPTLKKVKIEPLSKTTQISVTITGDANTILPALSSVFNQN